LDSNKKNKKLDTLYKYHPNYKKDLDSSPSTGSGVILYLKHTLYNSKHYPNNLNNYLNNFRKSKSH
jgi:hypothetical protein